MDSKEFGKLWSKPFIHTERIDDMYGTGSVTLIQMTLIEYERYLISTGKDQIEVKKIIDKINEQTS